MKKLKLFALAILALGVCMNLTSCNDDNDDEEIVVQKEEVYKEITLTTAGTLESLLGDDIYDVTTLKITGSLNGDDISCLRLLCDCENHYEYERIFSLTSLDLSDASIVEGGGAYVWEFYTSNDEIGDDLFANAYYLEKIILPKGVTRIGLMAFSSCRSLAEINIPDGVIYIGSGAFQGCVFSEITLPDGITDISGAFSSCMSLTKIKIPDSVVSLGHYTFSYCYDLTEVNIPESETYIGYDMFFLCQSLTEIIIPDGVTSIWDFAFYICSGLTEITIPSKVTSIGDEAFRFCSNLAEVYCLATEPPSLGSEVFDGISSDAILYVSKGSLDSYISSDWASYFSSVEEMD